MEEIPFDPFPPFVDPSSPDSAPAPASAVPAAPAAPSAPAGTAPQVSRPARRRRGAPPGNTNALKHGFYSRSFNQGDQQLLADIHFASLKDEITMLRVFIRRVTDLAAGVASLSEALSLLRVLSLASSSLTRLMTTEALFKTRYRRELARGELDEDIRQALQELFGDRPVFQKEDPGPTPP